MEYEAVIGLEVHAQLKTQTKLFCGDSIEFGADPNINTCPVCLGMPGVLPVLNRLAVEYGIKAALATNCTVHKRSIWARKNYFYPDLPKGYQISQYEYPLAEEGWVEIETEEGGTKRVGLTRIHMEEDAGKNIHLDGEDASLVDYNRSSVALIEIVSEPDMRTSKEASAYMRKLREILRYLGVCDGDLEKGSLRCDANISLRPVGQEKFGTRTEMKNINSFRYVRNALEYEIERQKEVLESGGKVIQETRTWDQAAGKTFAMRSKEESNDYRYFPDPDLIPLILDDAWIKDVQDNMPELGDDKRKRYKNEFGLPAYDAGVLTVESENADYFEATVAAGADPKKAANWIMVELMRYTKENNIEINDCKIKPAQLASMITMIDSGKISGKIAKSLLLDMLESGDDPESIVAKTPQYQLLSDESAIESIVDKVIADNPSQVEQYKANPRLFGFFVGQVMKASQGKADPGSANALLKKKLDG